MPRLIIWPEEDYAQLENEVRELVRALHRLGITTIMSCEGHIRSSPIYVGVLPWPWVIVVLDPEKLSLLTQKIDCWNGKNPCEKWILSTERIHKSFTPEYIAHMIARDFPGCIVRALCPEGKNEFLDPMGLLVSQLQAVDLANFLGKEQDEDLPCALTRI